MEAFADEQDLWRTAGGVTNSAGHLALHLEGNLREYVGRQLGGVGYQRDRPAEFAGPPKGRRELVVALTVVLGIVPEVIAGLTEEELAAPYPERVLGAELSTRQFLVHLHGHLTYHTGQIDYLRRMLTGGGALELVGL